MKEIDEICNKVLAQAKEQGGRMSAITYDELVERNERNFRQVKMRLLALGLIEKREDNKIKLTTKGLNVKTVKEASKKDKDWGKIGVIVTIVIFILSTIVAILLDFF